MAQRPITHKRNKFDELGKLLDELIQIYTFEIDNKIVVPVPATFQRAHADELRDVVKGYLRSPQRAPLPMTGISRGAVNVNTKRMFSGRSTDVCEFSRDGAFWVTSAVIQPVDVEYRFSGLLERMSQLDDLTTELLKMFHGTAYQFSVEYEDWGRMGCVMKLSGGVEDATEVQGNERVVAFSVPFVVEANLFQDVEVHRKVTSVSISSTSVMSEDAVDPEPVPEPVRPPIEWAFPPDLTGMIPTEADAALAAAVFRTGTVTSEYSDTVPVGLVSSQCPLPTTRVKKWEHVSYAVSLGPEPPEYGETPDLDGMDGTEASAAVTGAGYTVGTVGSRYSALIPVGEVAFQCPAAGELLVFGEAVSFDLSLGPEPPEYGETLDVEGTPQATAEAAVVAAGWTVGTVSSETSETVPLGSVIRQSPEPGVEYVFGEPISLVISAGPADINQLTFIEQTGQEISVSVEGLDADEFEIRKADGSVVTSPAEYTGTSGTARVRVFDASDLTKLERLQLDVKGPTAASKTVPNCATLTEAAANIAITAAGLTPDSDGAFSATVAKGLVISQSPAAGTAAYAGDIVTITVSFGVEFHVSEAGADLGPMATAWRLIESVRTNPIMTSNIAPSGVASASSVIGTGYEAWRAFDNVITTVGAQGWVVAAGVFPSWLQYQFAAPTAIKGYQITTRNEAGYPLAPKSWVFAGSLDGTTWVTLDTQTNITYWAALTREKKCYYLPTNDTAYTYYRITISAGNQNYAAIGELELCALLPVVAYPSKSLYLHNSGADTLTVTSITGPAWLTLTNVPATVAAGATATITATVNTAVAGAYTGDITVTASDGVTVMPVTATVYAPA